MGAANINFIHESDWLASRPYFYNTKTAASGININDVINYKDEELFDPEGLHNYLDFGYSVYGQTPVASIKYMPPSSRLIRNKFGDLELEHVSDPIDKWVDYKISESDIIDLIRERVQSWESGLASDQEIILPLSGGFDSRILLWSIRDKSRVRAFTYGISLNQDASTEVVHARTLAKKFNISWERIKLDNFHQYISNWYDIYGLSTHAHGMYHFDFYTQIRKKCPNPTALLSGIFGDVWAGSIPYTRLSDERDLVKLGYTHGLHADSFKSKLSACHDIRRDFWEQNKIKLNEPRFQTISTIRLKMILISYLISLPKKFGFDAWSPFLDIDISMAMLNLPPHRRNNRQWQRDFFVKAGLDLESQRLTSNRGNKLDFLEQKNHPVPKLNVNVLSDFFDADYLKWINKRIEVTRICELRTHLLSAPKLGGLLRRVGIRDEQMSAYSAYLCLKPIEKFLNQRVAHNMQRRSPFC